MNGSVSRTFRVEHLSRFDYEEPAHGSLMLLRLMPRGDGSQRTINFDLRVDPPAVPIPFTDSFGNSCHIFNIHRRHRHTEVRSELRVETVERPTLTESLGKDAWDALARLADPVQFWELLNPSHFTRPGPALEAFVAANGIRKGGDPLSSLMDMASRLNKAFHYEPGSTEVDTPIERFLATGRGVCQDYTHTMIAIGRSWGIPSRYVSGYLHLEGVSGEQTPEGASHSWAEFLLPEMGWIGIDPTNDTLADHRHVRIAVGRDYGDAAPTRGTVLGGGASRLEVRVAVTGDEPGAAPQAFRQGYDRIKAPEVAPLPGRGSDQ